MGVQSKGCGTCKRRKVKCDETHPQCTRCRKADIECTGYVQRLRFVDEKFRIRRSIAVSHTQSPESLTTTTTTKSFDLKFHYGQIPQSQALGPAPCLTNTLPLTAFKDDIFISYLFSKLFEEDYEYPVSAEGETRCGLPTDWVSELVKTPQKPRHKSWDALAAIVFGQAHNSYDVITDALKLYGQALSELRNELSDPDDRSTESTLASITALYRYEILVSKTEKGWMFHADGLEWLLKWRGPWKQKKSCTSKSIFLEHRIMLVAKSIISHQSTFLSDPIWKTVPWEDDPTSKLAIDYLVDIATDIVEYVAQIKTYDNSKSMSNQDIDYSHLRTQVAKSLEELNTWWRKWEAKYGGLGLEVTAHKSINEPLFPTLLEYDTLWTAFTVCIYDAIRILLLQLWHILQLRPSSIQTTADQAVVLDTLNRTALLGITSDIKGLACEILRSLGSGYRKSRRFICSFSFLFIQDVAYGCFDQGSKEAIWIAEHGWAEPTKFDDIENANLLRRLLPLGRIKAGDFRLDTSCGAATIL